MDYLLQIVIVIAIFTMLAQALSIPAGMGGMVSMTQAGFFGIGAYVAAVLSTRFNYSFPTVLLAAIVLGAILGVAVGALVVNARGDHFVVCTLGVQTIMMSVLKNWTGVTGGPLGIAGIPSAAIGPILVANLQRFALLAIALSCLVWWLIANVKRSGFGRSVRAARETEDFVTAVGRSAFSTKLMAFTMGSTLATIPGVIYAHYVSYVDPSTFSISQSIFIFCIAVLGGLESLPGILLAAVVFVSLPEALRFAGLPSGSAANLKQVVYGSILVAVMMTTNSPTPVSALWRRLRARPVSAQ